MCQGWMWHILVKEHTVVQADRLRFLPCIEISPNTLLRLLCVRSIRNQAVDDRLCHTTAARYDFSTSEGTFAKMLTKEEKRGYLESVVVAMYSTDVEDSVMDEVAKYLYEPDVVFEVCDGRPIC